MAGIRAVPRAALLCICVGLAMDMPYQVFQAYKAVAGFTGNPSQLAYEYAKEQPGAAYFPQNPLAHLMAEGKLYHFFYGIEDRELAGVLISSDHFRRYMPGRPTIIGDLPWDRSLEPFVRRYLPEYTEKVSDERLPGWELYKRQ